MQSGCLPNLAGAEEEAYCLFRPEACILLTLVFPVTSVASQSVDLELLEHLGVIQRQELVLDVLSKSLDKNSP